MLIVEHSVTLLHHTPHPEKIIEQAGRVCWKSEDRITEDSHVRFIRHLLDSNHESVIEHASAGFIIGTDRATANQIVRHRLASYSQMSTRYCNYSKDKFGGQIRVIKPIDLNESTQAYGEWYDQVRRSEFTYLNMLDAGCKPETARAILPHCLHTELVATANFRGWRNFLRLRLSSHAQPEVRLVARMIADELAQISPTIFGEFNASQG